MNKCDIYFCKLNNLRKSFTLLLPYPSAKKHKVLIRQNRKFHNIHMGQRCFILANGPSIQKENLELLDHRSLADTGANKKQCEPSKI